MDTAQPVALKIVPLVGAEGATVQVIDRIHLILLRTAMLDHEVASADLVEELTLVGQKSVLLYLIRPQKLYR